MDSDGTTSASENSGAETAAPLVSTRQTKRKANDGDAPLHKRKATYYLRKDEIASLQDQIKSLSEKLATYEKKAREQQAAVPMAMATNDFLHQHVDLNTLRVAGVQSMVTAYNLAMVQARSVVPFQSQVHLPADPERRQEIMEEIFATKLGAAVRFMAERTRFLDLRVRHRQSEQFELPDGEVTVVSMDVTQFDSGHSLRQVYDALMYFVVHQEISVSEKLGILTVRESDEIEEIKCCQTRFLSTVRGGVEVESNSVACATCVDASENTPGYAVGLLNCVDEDELYPYRSEMCIRKDVTLVMTLNEIPSSNGGKPTIVMARWSHVRVPPRAFAISEEADREVRSGMLQWCEIVPTIMNERLATIPPAP